MSSLSNSPIAPGNEAAGLQASAEAVVVFRQQVLDAVRRDGADRHQIEVDRLVWIHAHLAAAQALRVWADLTQHPTAVSLASLAEIESHAYLMNRDAASSTDVRLAELTLGDDRLEDLDATDEHRLFRSSLRAFAEREISPHARSIHREDLDVPEHVIAGVAALGLFGLSVPTEFGGVQAHEDVKAMLIATEELSRASLSAGGSLMTRPEILVRALLRGGTTEQKRTWLPAIASGEKLVAVAVTEPDFGSNVADVTCRATRLPDGDWLINGTKLWCTFAGRAELLMVLCRTGGIGHKGLSIFIVDKPAFSGHEFAFRPPDGGMLLAKAIPTIGYRGMHTFELVFEGFRVPAAALLGGEEWLNRGFYLQMESFAMGRIQTAGRAVGVMQAAVDDSIDYARSRIAFGHPLFANQLIRAKIGRMVLRLQASRQLSYYAARLLNSGSGQIEASLAKVYASRMAELVTREAMQLHGAMGYSEETDIARYFVDARVLAIFEGAEEVLSLRVIGKALLEQSP